MYWWLWYGFDAVIEQCGGGVDAISASFGDESERESVCLLERERERERREKVGDLSMEGSSVGFGG